MTTWVERPFTVKQNKGGNNRGGDEKLFGGKSPDRVERNSSDGQTFYGYDHKDGTTSWLDRNGNLDSVTKTPKDDD